MSKRTYLCIIIIIASMCLIACSSNTKTVNLLELTEQENEIYAEFAREHEDNILRELELLSLCKLYLHSGIIHDYETQYEFYIQDEKHLGWTKEKHLEDAHKYSQIKKDFKKFENAKNLEITYSEDETSAFIKWTVEDEEYKRDDGTYYRFQFELIKNERGIWKVNFLPMQ